MFDFKNVDKVKVKRIYKKTIDVTYEIVVWCSVAYLAYSFGKHVASSECNSNTVG